MTTRDRFTLVKDALCMIVALGGAIYEASRDGPERWGLLAFYACLLGFGTAVPAAMSLFTNQSGAQADPLSVTSGSPSPSTPPVDLTHPRRARRGDGGTTSSRSRSRR
jgi:hypothetical protein